MEAMHFRRWLDIKACLKQNRFWEEKKKTDKGYDPTQKYRLVWDVMTHNMNQLIDKGGLDLTLNETTWPNSSYARQKQYYAPFMGYKFIAYLCP